MTAKFTARFVLRAATAQDHDRVDAAFGRFDLGDINHYRAFLRAQHDAFLPVESAIDRVDLSRVLPDWADRRRVPALVADIRDLGDDAPPLVDALEFTSVEAALGAVYVLEGSRLGGRMLARSVPASFPRRFLDTGAPGLWQKLIEVLDLHLTSQDDIKIAGDAARAVFARFEASARLRQKDILS